MINGEDKLWKTKDGRTLEISRMGTDHIISTIAMLKRNNFVGLKTWNTYMGANVGNMPDGAQDAFLCEFDRVMDCQICNELDWLEDELKSRQLN